MLPKLVTVFLPIYMCIIYIYTTEYYSVIKRNAICSNIDKP